MKQEKQNIQEGNYTYMEDGNPGIPIVIVVSLMIVACIAILVLGFNFLESKII